MRYQTSPREKIARIMRSVSVGSRSIAVPRGSLTQPNAILRPRRGYRCQSERLKLFRNGYRSQMPLRGEQAERIGVACETFHIKDQFAAEGIVEEAKARNCDLIVMGSHGRQGFARFLLGSQALRVLTHTALTVLVYR